MRIAQNFQWWSMVSERSVHDWADWALKALLVGIIAISVNYLRNVADHLSSLDIAVKEIQYELKSSSSVQSVVNQDLKDDIIRLNNRMDKLEHTILRRNR